MSARIVMAALALFSTTACISRIDHFGRPPTMSPLGAPRKPVSEAPPDLDRQYPAPRAEEGAYTTASLWRDGPQSLFGDRRARIAGDIVTVVVEIDEEAEISNQTDLNRSASEGLSAPALFGLETLAQRVLPGGAGLDEALSISSNSTTAGDGSVQREERITLRVAATVRRVLPNGYLAIEGSQEVRVNHELRDLQVTGIVRIADISRTNEITYDKIAEARIAYGGRGVVSDVQNPRYGQQALDAINPF